MQIFTFGHCLIGYFFQGYSSLTKSDKSILLGTDTFPVTKQSTER